MSCVYETLGRNIRAARKSAGLSQQSVAKALGISLVCYGRYERGEREPSLDLISQIASTLHVPVYQLFHGCFPCHEGVFAHSPVSCAENLVPLLESCSARKLQLICDVVRLIAADSDI